MHIGKNINTNNNENLFYDNPSVETSGKSNFTLLPQELIIGIFSFIKVKDMGKVMAVNEYFHSLTRQSLKIRLRPYLSEEQIKVVFQSKKNIFLKLPSIKLKKTDRHRKEFNYMVCNINFETISPVRAEQLKKFLFEQGYLKTIKFLLSKRVLSENPTNKIRVPQPDYPNIHKYLNPLPNLSDELISKCLLERHTELIQNFIGNSKPDFNAFSPFSNSVNWRCYAYAQELFKDLSLENYEKQCEYLTQLISFFTWPTLQVGLLVAIFDKTLELENESNSDLLFSYLYNLVKSISLASPFSKVNLISTIISHLSTWSDRYQSDPEYLIDKAKKLALVISPLKNKSTNSAESILLALAKIIIPICLKNNSLEYACEFLNTHCTLSQKNIVLEETNNIFSKDTRHPQNFEASWLLTYMVKGESIGENNLERVFSILLKNNDLSKASDLVDGLRISAQRKYYYELIKKFIQANQIKMALTIAVKMPPEEETLYRANQICNKCNAWNAISKAIQSAADYAEFLKAAKMLPSNSIDDKRVFDYVKTL